MSWEYAVSALYSIETQKVFDLMITMKKKHLCIDLSRERAYFD